MKKVFPLALLSLLIIASCKKKDEATPAIAKIKTAIIPDLIGGTIDTLNYFYNNDGTVEKVTYGTGLAKRVYVYGSNSISEVFYNYTGSIAGTTTYFLNDAGLADSMYDSSTDYRYSYEYDANGFLTKSTFRGPSNNISSVQTYVNNGTNVTNTYAADAGGTVTSSTEQTFFTDKKNTTGNENIGKKFLGKSSANPGHTWSSTSLSTTYTGSWSYSYDSEGRILLQNMLNNAGTVFGTNTYTYY
jgi:hypothetical protein